MEEKNPSFMQWDFANNQQTAEQSAAEAQRLSEEAKIREILAEQQKLQQLYNQVVVFIQQHPNMPTEEMIKYQTQLKQLSEYYQTNQEKLKTLGYSSVQVNKNVVIKKGAKRNVSIKELFIWCAVIIFFFVLWLWVLSFYLANNPENLWGFWALWITPAVAKSILSLLSVTVMMVILLLGLVIVIVNTYRAFTIKNKPKGWYYSWLVFWLLIVWIALWAGTSLISKVWAIDVESIANPEDVIKLNMVRYETQSNGEVRADVHQIDNSFPLVAPMTVSASLFSANYWEFVKAVAPWVRIRNIELDCWNGEILPISRDEINFAGYCFYTKKWTYEISLLLTHMNWNNEINTTTHKLKNLVMNSEIKFNGLNGGKINIWNDELTAGPLPTDIEYDAEDVFQSFGLTSYNIEWDWDNDNNIDKLSEVKYRHSYDSSKVYYPKVRFPDVKYLDGDWGIWYSFPLRITQSSTPVCKVDIEKKEWQNYEINGYFLDWTERSVRDYSFVIEDKISKSVLEEYSKDEWNVISYAFLGQWIYVVTMNFVTDDGYNGSCSQEVKISWTSQFNVQYEFSAQTTTSNGFEKLDTEKIKQEKVIWVQDIPTKLKLKLQSIEPKTSDTKVTVTFDWQPKIYTSVDEYLFDIRDSEQHTIQIKVEDTKRWLNYEENLTAKISLDDIVWRLVLIWETSWYEPLTVQLDASSSRLTDSSDEITYFTWDFWDGQTQQKISKWVVSHQYHFDYKNNNGIFTPKVTIYTKRWRTLTVNANDSIVVKKQIVKLEIYSTTHPLQEAKAGESVNLALEFSGLPTKISWDFWDGQTSECQWRTCSEITRSWSKAWTYLVKAYVEFEDQQSVEQTMQFKIR